MEEENLATMRRWIKAVWVDKDLSTVGEILDPAVVNHNVPPPVRQGKENFINTLKVFLEAIPDVSNSIDDLFAAGDKVVWRGTFAGTPARPILMLGVEPTGKSFAVQQLHIFRLSNGKIVEHWLSWNQLELRQQLGLLSFSNQ